MLIQNGKVLLFEEGGFAAKDIRMVDGLIQEISDHLGINRSYLHRIFKASTDSSLQNYLLDRRIHHACILLQDTELTIQVIAHSVGYPDPLNFSRIFHQKIGMSPSGYRKDFREKSAHHTAH